MNKKYREDVTPKIGSLKKIATFNDSSSQATDEYSPKKSNGIITIQENDYEDDDDERSSRVRPSAKSGKDSSNFNFSETS